MTTTSQPLTQQAYDDAVTLWEYHDLNDDLRPVDVLIGLGSHDLGVATRTAELYQCGLAPLIVFSGANAPTTVERFPRGEAVHYREQALALGVPPEAILIESTATNTGENITRTRELLDREGIHVSSAILVTRPYQQRRAYATAKKLWPQLDLLCTAQRIDFDAYLDQIADVDRVVNMLVGDTQRITTYAEAGFAIPQHIPADVAAAFDRLVGAGYTARLA